MSPDILLPTATGTLLVLVMIFLTSFDSLHVEIAVYCVPERQAARMCDVNSVHFVVAISYSAILTPTDVLFTQISVHLQSTKSCHRL